MTKWKALWDLMRLEHGLMIAFAIFIGLIIMLQSKGGFSLETFPWFPFILTFFTALFLEASTFALNDYYDLEIDKKNKRNDRPLVRGDLQPKTAVFVFCLFFPLGILCSFFVNFSCFLIALITAIFAIFYDCYLKKIKLLGNFYIAYVMAIPFIFGAVAIEKPGSSLMISIEPAVFMLALIAFFAGSGREIMKDIMDYEGDALSGVRSFPSYVGIRKSAALTSLFYLLAVCFSLFPFFVIQFSLYHFNYVYLGFVVVTDLIFLWTIFQLFRNESLDLARYRKLTLLGFFLALIGFFLGAFIG